MKLDADAKPPVRTSDTLLHFETDDLGFAYRVAVYCSLPLSAGVRVAGVIPPQQGRLQVAQAPLGRREPRAAKSSRTVPDTGTALGPAVKTKLRTNPAVH